MSAITSLQATFGDESASYSTPVPDADIRYRTFDGADLPLGISFEIENLPTAKVAEKPEIDPELVREVFERIYGDGNPDPIFKSFGVSPDSNVVSINDAEQERGKFGVQIVEDGAGGIFSFNNE